MRVDKRTDSLCLAQKSGGYPAVFWHLRDLRVGNAVAVIDESGDWIPSQHQTTLRLVVYTALD
jgi:hypothetical protein